MTILYYFIYLPFLKLLSLPIFWIPEYEERKKFEKKNQRDQSSQSFSDTQEKADLCFEFSSEGEFQQVASLVEDALKEGKKVELIYFSPSVEKAIQKISEVYPHQTRSLRFPLLTSSYLKKRFSIPRWITANKLILVRYDLFLDFLCWKKMRKGEIYFLSVTFKKERLKNKKISWLKKIFLKSSSQIFFASEIDQSYGNELGFKGHNFDFRLEQIARRIAHRKEKFQSIFTDYAEVKKRMELFPSHKRLIFGNVWPSDIFLLEDLPADYFLLIIPHRLDDKTLREFTLAMEKLDRDHSENTVLLNKKGVLCELYVDFQKAYVGGGFEAGVHSILEPYVAGCPLIACGERNLKSTEFDVAFKEKKITVVQNASEFLTWIQQNASTHEKLEIQNLVTQYEKYKKEIFLC
jgi:3-deoxy-D-manno-octulosonic-acid transferase